MYGDRGSTRNGKEREAGRRSRRSSMRPIAHILAANLGDDCKAFVQCALPRFGIEVNVVEDVFDALFGDIEPIHECLILGSPLEDLSEIRSLGVDLPILALISNSSVDGRVSAFEAGANDCLGAPFAIAELAARIHALCRSRVNSAANGKVTSGDISLCIETRSVISHGRNVSLSPTEAKILGLLIENCGRVLSSETITRTFWGDNADVCPNLVAVHIANLRRKLSDGLTTSPIRTIHGCGYTLAESGAVTNDGDATSDEPEVA